MTGYVWVKWSVAVGWLILAVFVWSLCAIADRSDRRMGYKDDGV